MKWKFYRNLGACDPPQAPLEKDIAPAVLAAIIAGGSVVASGVGNLISQANSNEANRDIARETNAANAKMHEQDLAAQRQLYMDAKAENRYLVNQAWNREQQYKDPKNLRDAYLRAGINPAFAMQNGGFGSLPAASTGSAPTASVPKGDPAVTGAPQQSLDFSAFGYAGNQAAQTYLAYSENTRKDYALANDIEVSRTNAQANLIKAQAEAKQVGLRADFQDFERQRALDNYWLEVDRNAQVKESQQIEHDLSSRALDLKQNEIAINEHLANSKIKLDQSTINQIANEIQATKDQVEEMKKKGRSEREINKYIAKKEKEVYEMTQRENERGKRNESTPFRQAYKDFTDWLFTPLKGLFSVGIK